MEMNLHNNFTN